MVYNKGWSWVKPHWMPVLVNVLLGHSFTHFFMYLLSVATFTLTAELSSCNRLYGQDGL